MKEATNFVETIKDALRRVLPLLSRSHPGERISGFALCTDDSLSTLFHVASTREFVARSRAPFVEFVPVEWKYADGAEHLEEANKILESRYRATTKESFPAHVDQSFREMAAALQELKAEGLFDETVFLTVCSTDPGPELEEMETSVVTLLNSKEVADRWMHAMRRTPPAETRIGVVE